MSRPRLIALLLALVTCAIYLPAGHYGFSRFDDNNFVTENDIVQSGLTWTGVRWAFITGRTGIWMPLTWISHMAVCQGFGLQPGAHHLVNVLFHAANSVLLFWLLRRLTRALWPSAFAAALFAWHPLHVESVAWIAERKDMLSTFFGLASLLAYARYAQSRGEPSPLRCAATGERDSIAMTGIQALDPRRWTFDYLLGLVLFALSLMSKPMLVTLPFVMLLLDYWPLQRTTAMKGGLGRAFLRLSLEKWPFFALSAALCVVAFLNQYVDSLEMIPVSDRLENVPLAYARYLLQMIWPAQLIVFYSFPLYISPLLIAATSLVLLLISATVWLGRKRNPYWLVGWLWFLGTLVPVNGLVAFGGQAMANRFTYFPSIGIFLALALGMWGCASRFQFSTRVVAVTAGAVAAVCLALTGNQLRYWRDDVALFSHVIDVTKDTRWVRYRDLGILHFHLGLMLERRGQKAEAMSHYLAAVRVRPSFPDANNQLGNVLAAEGKWDEAIVYYNRALQIQPGNDLIHFNLGNALAAKGSWDEAIPHYERVLQLKPEYAEAHSQLGFALARQGRFEAAIIQYQEALRLNPGHIETHIRLGAIFGRSGKLDEALGQFQAVLKLNPENIDALFNAGLTFYHKGQPDEAIEVFRKVIKLAPNHADAHNNLGLLLGLKGQPDEAINQFQEALRLNPNDIKARNNLDAAMRSKGAPLAPSANP